MFFHFRWVVVALVGLRFVFFICLLYLGSLGICLMSKGLAGLSVALVVFGQFLPRFSVFSMLASGFCPVFAIVIECLYWERCTFCVQLFVRLFI